MLWLILYDNIYALAFFILYIYDSHVWSDTKQGKVTSYCRGAGLFVNRQEKLGVVFVLKANTSARWINFLH